MAADWLTGMWARHARNCHRVIRDSVDEILVRTSGSSHGRMR